MTAITPEQCRWACILLGWSWTDFAVEDGVDGAVASAAHELKSGHDVDHEQLAAIQRALEAAGVRFAEHGAELLPEAEVKAGSRSPNRD